MLAFPRASRFALGRFASTAAVGSRIPAATLVEKPGSTVDTDALFKGKKVVVFAVPGAFTPGCSKSHLPGYIEKADAIKAKGVDEIVCIAVNDPFVMQAWGEQHKAEGKVRMLSDPAADLTKKLGLELDLTSKLGSVRSKRYSAIVEDGTIKALHVEPDGAGLTCSLAPAILAELK